MLSHNWHTKTPARRDNLAGVMNKIYREILLNLDVIAAQQGNGLALCLTAIDVLLAPDTEFVQDTGQTLAVVS